MSSLETIGVYQSVVTAELLDTEMCLFYPLVLGEYTEMVKEKPKVFMLHVRLHSRYTFKNHRSNCRGTKMTFTISSSTYVDLSFCE